MPALYKGRPHLRVLPDPAYQRGDEVIEKLRDFNLKTKANAKREVLAEVASHYMQEPGKPLLAHEVAEDLVARAEEIGGTE